jgi:hypothetical protein
MSDTATPTLHEEGQAVAAWPSDRDFIDLEISTKAQSLVRTVSGPRFVSTPIASGSSGTPKAMTSSVAPSEEFPYAAAGDDLPATRDIASLQGIIDEAKTLPDFE